MRILQSNAVSFHSRSAQAVQVLMIFLRPKKVRQSVDPELIKAVEAKLALLNADPLTSPTTMTVTVP